MGSSRPSKPSKSSKTFRSRHEFNGFDDFDGFDEAFKSQLIRRFRLNDKVILSLSLQHVNFLERQQKRLDTAIAQRMESIPHTLDTIPGFGPVFSSGIIAEIGGVQRFNCDQAKVAKYAGFKWRRHQSGDFKADESRLTRTGNRYLRYYFCEAANSVRMHDRDYAAFYNRKYKEVRKHQHKRAIVLTARKLVRLVVRLLATNQPYQPLCFGYRVARTGRCAAKS